MNAVDCASAWARGDEVEGKRCEERRGGGDANEAEVVMVTAVVQNRRVDEIGVAETRAEGERRKERWWKWDEVGLEADWISTEA